MPELNPDFLLSNPGLVEPMAPWCVAAENLELGILLLSQPWMTGGGLRRADLERQLNRLGAEMPLGPVYFQRVNRSVAGLEALGSLSGAGRGRSRRFTVTPEGFAALILNLRVLRRDPTVDGSEFEFKRAVVAMWNLVLERVLDLGDGLFLQPETDDFFQQVESLSVLGEPVITEELLRSALDVRGLIDLQRRRVQALMADAEERLGGVSDQARLLRALDPFRPGAAGAPALQAVAGGPAALALLQDLAAGSLPRLTLKTKALRYRQYLQYLDRLERLYNRELKPVDLNSLRRLSDGRGG